ncbi:adenylyltransferase/cytidyltransferase family protein [Streptomyces xanthophaeus]|uniref:adenylyltransferase/cytidyltransferase family protein n=1 Tax=Streptomyces xanthophaeus TaxID=67385 RepID=UPI00345F889E|nr:adenylyltransferase/cytidyltransferase family protein [Streptomyces xanthophaeus]
MRALFPGSFDPITQGHQDVLRRAALLFDEVVVCVMFNPNKTGRFPIAERLTGPAARQRPTWATSRSTPTPAACWSTTAAGSASTSSSAESAALPTWTTKCRWPA